MPPGPCIRRLPEVLRGGLALQGEQRLFSRPGWGKRIMEIRVQVVGGFGVAYPDQGILLPVFGQDVGAPIPDYVPVDNSYMLMQIRRRGQVYALAHEGIVQ